MKKKILFLASLLCTLSLTSVTVYAAEVDASVCKSWSNFFDYFFNCPTAVVVAVVSLVVLLALIIFAKPIAKKLNYTSGTQMINAFIVIFAVCGIGCFVMTLISDGVTWAHLLRSNVTSTGQTYHFYDYLDALRDSGRMDFTDSAAKLTPMSMLIFYIIAQFMPNKYIESKSLVDIIAMTKHQSFVYCYLIILLFLIALIYRLNRNVLRRNDKIRFRAEIIAFLLIFSYPAMYCIKMGNIVGMCLTLLMFFIVFKEHEKNYMRELSLIALALSAAIKPVTLLFVIILVAKEKEAIARTIRTVIYSIVLFIAPAFFTGFESLGIYLKNMFVVIDEVTVDNIAVSSFFRFADIQNDVPMYIICAIFYIVAIACIFILPSVWQKSAAAVYCIINISPQDSTLCTILLFIPLILLLAEKKHKTVDWIYFAIISLLVVPIPEWFYFDRENFLAVIECLSIFDLHNANEIIAPFAVMFLFILIVADSITTLVKKKNKLPIEETIEA